MSVDESKLTLWSGANYMKRSRFCDSVMVAGKIDAFTEVHPVPHGLGYIPFTQVFCDVYNDGRIWARSPVDNAQDEINGYASGYYAAPTFQWMIDTVALHLFFAHSSAGASNGTLYWLIYKDYGDV